MKIDLSQPLLDYEGANIPEMDNSGVFSDKVLTYRKFIISCLNNKPDIKDEEKIGIFLLSKKLYENDIVDIDPIEQSLIIDSCKKFGTSLGLGRVTELFNSK